jgi:hypothetical protein
MHVNCTSDEDHCAQLGFLSAEILALPDQL